MVTWATKVYYGEKVKKKKDGVMNAINHGEMTLGIYCITFASNQENLFDVLDANELLFPHYKRTEIQVLGLAKGYQEALKLVQRMVLEVYQSTGGFDVRTYFT